MRLYFTFFILHFLPATSIAITYYISPAGKNTNSGTSISNPWQTISKINNKNFNGDTILFLGGSTFTGNIGFTSSDLGTPAKPIVIGSYGTGRATISSGNSYGISIYNAGGFNIKNLIFKGSGRTINTQSGILFYMDKDSTTLSYVKIDSVEVYGYKYSGISIGSWNKSSGYIDVSVTNSLSHDNGKAGISTYAQEHYVHKNVYIGYNKVYNNPGIPEDSTGSTGNGIVLGNVNGAVIEYCTSWNNGWLHSNPLGGPVGIWAYASNNVIIQFNESHHNKTGTGKDGGGFDFDGGCTNSTLQYNYSHDNEGAGYLLANYTGSPLMKNIIIRYNISENDGRRNDYGAIHMWAPSTNEGFQMIEIYNNTVYLTPNSNGNNCKAFYIRSGKLSGVNIRNNIFQTKGGIQLVNVGSTAGCTFQGNNFWSTGSTFKIYWGGTTYSSLTTWRTATGQEKINGTSSGFQSDPQFSDTTTGVTFPEATQLNTLNGYKLKPISDLINKGLNLTNLFGLNVGTTDFWGNNIINKNIFNIGAYQVTVANLPEQCSPISTLSCPAIVQNLPLIINFSGSEGGLLDKNGVTTGFTMVDKPSAPLVPSTYYSIPGYEPSKLEISTDKLIITTTAGISSLNPAQSAKTNSQVNALGEGFVAPSKFTIQTTLVQPNAGTGKFEQAGLWFGLDEDNYVKLVVVSAGSGASKIEMRKEVAALSATSDVKSTGSMTLSSSLVKLKFLIDKVANTIEGFYSINGGTDLSIGALSIPQSLTSGKTLNDGVTTNITFAGIFASHRSATTAIPFSFEDFKVEPVEVTDPSPDQCSPISSFSCPEVVKNLPATLNFTGSEGGLQDKNGAATGFTMVDRPSAPLVTPTYSNTPGYEPSKLEIFNDKLIITTTAGLSFLNPAKSAKTNSQVNALGVGFVAPSKFTIQATLVQPNAGTGKSEQAGLWFGLDEDNFVKLVVVSAGSGTSKVEMRNEVAATSSSTDLKSTAAMTLSSSLVKLKFLIDKAAGTIEGFYSINGGTEVSIGILSIPQSFTDGKTLSDGVTTNITFAGIYASHRSAATPVTFSFEDFKAEQVIVTDPSPDQCSPISSLSCPEVVKNLPSILNFTGSEGGLQDKNGAATGFTMVDKPSAPLVTPTYSNTPGYEPSKLEIFTGKLIITTTAGISFLNPAKSTKTNSQVNALGVGFVAPSKFLIQTTLVQPNAGTGKSEQAGLWFGLDEDNFVKLVVVSAGSGTSKIEMRNEVTATSSATDLKSTGAMTLSSSLVKLKFLIDKTASTIEGFYSINGGTEISIGALSIPPGFTNGKTLSDGVTTNITFGGIYATHRSATTALTFSFEDFNVEEVTTSLSLNASENPNFSKAQKGFSSIANNSLRTKNNFAKPNVYPNPLQKRFNLEFPEAYQGIFSLQIVDQLGKIYEIGTYRLNKGGSNKELDISHLFLKAGIYSLRIHSDTRKTEVIKLIIQ